MTTRLADEEGNVTDARYRYGLGRAVQRLLDLGLGRSRLGLLFSQRVRWPPVVGLIAYQGAPFRKVGTVLRRPRGPRQHYDNTQDIGFVFYPNLAFGYELTCGEELGVCFH